MCVCVGGGGTAWPLAASLFLNGFSGLTLPLWLSVMLHNVNGFLTEAKVKMDLRLNLIIFADFSMYG